MTPTARLLASRAAPDIRSLSPQIRAELRREVVLAVRHGMTQGEASRHYGVSRRSVGVWTRADQPNDAEPAQAVPALDVLTPGQEAAVLDVMRTADPSFFRLQGHLWTRRSVTDLIRIVTGHCPAEATVMHYLHRWRLASEAPSGLGPDLVGACRMRVSWHNISPPGCQVIGHPPVPAQRWPALVAESGHGVIHFRLCATATGLEALRAFGGHLAQQMQRSVTLFVWRWPPDRTGMLEEWRADAGPGIRIERGSVVRPVAALNPGSGQIRESRAGPVHEGERDDTNLGKDGEDAIEERVAVADLADLTYVGGN